MRPKKNGKSYAPFRKPVDLTDDELLKKLGGPKEPIGDGETVEGPYTLKNRINRISVKHNETITVSSVSKQDGEIYLNITDKNGNCFSRELKKQFTFDEINSFDYYAAKTLYGTAICLNAIAASFAMLRFVNDLVFL